VNVLEHMTGSVVAGVEVADVLGQVGRVELGDERKASEWSLSSRGAR
jgi:hypothetical protein